MRGMIQTIEEVIANDPKVHGEGTYGLEPDVIAELKRVIKKDARTFETGAGISTFLFALQGARHTVVTPAEEEIARITDYSQKNGISLEKVNFLPQFSWQALPQFTPESFDVALVDGCHGVPMVQVDFFYTSLALKVGGVLVLDDVYLWPVHDLLEFLKQEPAWRFDCIRGKTGFLTKMKSGQEFNEWVEQDYIVKKTASIPHNWPILHLSRRIKRKLTQK
jgi:predicted O-methyltransferase YrrM